VEGVENLHPVGFYTGVRLGDVVAMALPCFDFDKHVLKVRPQRTGRKKRDLTVPLHPQLEAHGLDLPLSDNQGPLCPALAKRRVSGKCGLSIQFHNILASADVKQETIVATGDAGHSFNKYTFHSLR
jgi:integrase